MTTTTTRQKTSPKKIQLDPPYLDDEERAMIKALHEAMDKGELVSVLTEARKKELEQAARNTKTAKRKPISLRVIEHDLLWAKAEAARRGIPYQTFLGSIIHQCATGELVPA